MSFPDECESSPAGELRACGAGGEREAGEQEAGSGARALRGDDWTSDAAAVWDRGEGSRKGVWEVSGKEMRSGGRGEEARGGEAGEADGLRGEAVKERARDGREDVDVRAPRSACTSRAFR